MVFPRYVRFVAGDEEDGYDQSGVFTVANNCAEDGTLNKFEAERLEEIFEWFNDNLPCPPFQEKLKSREWSRDAVAWFREDADEMTGRMWELVWMLRNVGIEARMIVTTKPGKIVYEDEFQIVAETPRVRALKL